MMIGKTIRRSSVSEEILTPRQLEILRLIQEWRGRSGCSPTLQELADQLGISKITVFEHAGALVEKGLLLRQANRSRSLRLSEKGSRFLGAIPPAESGSEKSRGAGAVFPMAGYVAAGLPVETLETPDQLNLGELFGGSRERYALRVRGDSMIGQQIREGDFVLVEKTNQARPGQMVIALLENGETTLKTLRKHSKGYILEAANPAYEPIFTDNLRIQGVVVGVIRKCG